MTQSPRPEDQSDRKRAGKKEEKGKGKTSKDDGDEVDKALAELSLKSITFYYQACTVCSMISLCRYPDLQDVARSVKSGENTAGRSTAEQQNALLAVSLPHLDSEAEMRKFFGAKVVRAFVNLP